MSVDPVESEPPYAYVQGNPINRSDPFGLDPQEDGVGTDYMYSCNCGWIDWNHAGPGQGKYVIEQVESVQTQSVGFAPISLGNRFGEGRKKTINLGGQELEIWVRHGIDGVVLVYTDLPDVAQMETALGIFISAQNLFEEAQGGTAANSVYQLARKFLPTLVPRADSTFAEEDLMSDLIGFYRGLRSHYLGWSPEASQQYYMRICDVVGRGEPNFKTIQKDIYDDYAKPFKKNRIWGRPRLDGWDGPIESENCETCKRPRRIPSDFISIQPRPPHAGWGWRSGNIILQIQGKHPDLPWSGSHSLDPQGLNQRPLNWSPRSN